MHSSPHPNNRQLLLKDEMLDCLFRTPEVDRGFFDIEQSGLYSVDCVLQMRADFRFHPRRNLFRDRTDKSVQGPVRWIWRCENGHSI